jgi:hypothetical protein
MRGSILHHNNRPDARKVMWKEGHFETTASLMMTSMQHPTSTIAKEILPDRLGLTVADVEDIYTYFCCCEGKCDKC